jgi:hypothetical protein
MGLGWGLGLVSCALLGVFCTGGSASPACTVDGKGEEIRRECVHFVEGTRG